MLRAILLVLGIGYLFAEFWFNASLLEMLGGVFGRETLHSIEILGKLISGVGLWLAAMKLVALGSKRMGVFNTFIVSVLTLVGSIAFMSTLQQSIATNLANNSTTAERKAAYVISIAMPDVVAGNTKIAGFDLSTADYKTGEGKTYIALLPAFAISHPDAARLFPLAAETALSNLKEETALSKGLEAWQGYSQLREALRLQFNEQYIQASEQFNESGGGTPEDLWGKYLAKMDEKNIDISKYQGDRIRTHIIQSLAEKGLKLPADWELNDKDTFLHAASSVNSQQKFSEEISRRLGRTTHVPPNLSWESFSSYPDIQDELRARMGLKDKSYVSLNLTQRQFFDVYVKKEANAQAGEILKVLHAPLESFDEIGVNAEVGKEAIKRVKVPVISLGFSCLFAVINLAMLLSGFIPGWTGKVATLVFALLVVLIPLKLENRISSSEAFDKVIARVSDPVALSLKWVTNAQPYVSPIGRAIEINYKEVDKGIQKLTVTIRRIVER